MQISSPNYLPRSTPDFSIPRQPKFRLMFVQPPAPKPQLAEPEPERPFPPKTARESNGVYVQP